MCGLVVVLLLSLLSLTAAKFTNEDNQIPLMTISGFAYEMLASQLHLIHHKLLELDSTVQQLSKQMDHNFTALQTQSKEHRESFELKLSQQQTLSAGLRMAVDQLNRTIGNNLTVLQMQTNEMLTQQTVQAKRTQLRPLFKKLKSPKDLARVKICLGLDLRNVSVRSCKEEPSKLSGKYVIQPEGHDEPILGYCEQTNFGGGWLVIQHRYDGSTKFNRSWADYRKGFGNVNEEHWLGLENLHRLTSKRQFELLVELRDFDGKSVVARYDDFQIASEEKQYALNRLGSFNGTAGDSLDLHKGMKFSTWDRDNDASETGHCAVKYGPWWHNKCHVSNLNGAYKKVESYEAMIWYHYLLKPQGLAYSRMLIREK